MMDVMNSQYRTIVRQKILDAQAAELPVLTQRDVWLPTIVYSGST